MLETLKSILSAIRKHRDDEFARVFFGDETYKNKKRPFFLLNFLLKPIPRTSFEPGLLYMSRKRRP